MKKVAVVNRTNLKNFGSVLQVYALTEAIRGLGYDAEVIWEQGNLSKHFDIRPNKLFRTALKLLAHPKLLSGTLKTADSVRAREFAPETVEKFNSFVDTYITQTTLSHSALVKRAKSDEYAKFVCGSDQVWCSTTLYVDPLMYLRFAPEQKRVAYAPSIGRDYIPNYNKRQMRKYISQIPHVSIRETEGQRLIRELTGRNVPVVLDPTLLFDKAYWSRMTVPVSEVVGGEYVLCYFLDQPNPEAEKAILQYAAAHGLPILSLGCPVQDPTGAVKILCPPCGPCEFMYLVEHAHSVFTDSYHGMLFSINFEKRFYSIERDYGQYDQSSRQMTVLERLNLCARYKKTNEPFTFSDDDIDYSSVFMVLKELRGTSLQYLNHALE